MGSVNYTEKRTTVPPTSAEEQTVIDEFQGCEAYEAVMRDPERYIVSPAQNTPLLSSVS